MGAKGSQSGQVHVHVEAEMVWGNNGAALGECGVRRAMFRWYISPEAGGRSGRETLSRPTRNPHKTPAQTIDEHFPPPA